MNYPLSLQTWFLHFISILDWILCIESFYKYSIMTKTKIILVFVTILNFFFLSGISIITWHYFFNYLNLKWLLCIQASFTVLGNINLMNLWRKNERRI